MNLRPLDPHTAVVLPAPVLALALLFVFARVGARLERSRFAALLDVELVDPVVPITPDSWWRRAVQAVRSAARWKEIAYHVLHLPLGLFTTGTTALAWCVSTALVVLPFMVDDLADGRARLGFFEVGPGAGASAAGVVGVLGIVLVAPWVTVAMAGNRRSRGSLAAFARPPG